MRRVLPCIVLLFARPASPAQQHDDRSPTFPKFESSAHVSDKCMACARILDCLKEGLLPRLRHLQEVKRRSYSKSKYQRLGAVGVSLRCISRCELSFVFQSGGCGDEGIVT